MDRKDHVQDKAEMHILAVATGAAVNKRGRIKGRTRWLCVDWSSAHWIFKWRCSGLCIDGKLDAAGNWISIVLFYWWYNKSAEWSFGLWPLKKYGRFVTYSKWRGFSWKIETINKFVFFVCISVTIMQIFANNLFSTTLFSFFFLTGLFGN